MIKVTEQKRAVPFFIFHTPPPHKYTIAVRPSFFLSSSPLSKGGCCSGEQASSLQPHTIRVQGGEQWFVCSVLNVSPSPWIRWAFPSRECMFTHRLLNASKCLFGSQVKSTFQKYLLLFFYLFKRFVCRECDTALWYYCALYRQLPHFQWEAWNI